MIKFDQYFSNGLKPPTRQRPPEAQYFERGPKQKTDEKTDGRNLASQLIAR